MDRRIAVVASGTRHARRVSRELARRMPALPHEAHSLSAYLDCRDPAPRVVLGALGPGGAALKFLRAAAGRLFWPAPPEELEEAIAGLRSPGHPAAGPRPRRAGTATSGLLLEGRVDARRARSAFASGATRDWIVESPVHVRLGAALLERLRRGGIRWSALEPLEVLAVCVSPELWRRRAAWRAWVPRGTPVWVEGAGQEDGPPFSQTLAATKIRSSSPSRTPRRASASRISSARSAGKAAL